MTDQEIIKRFYEDIEFHKKESENWFNRLFDFLGNVATHREIYEVLPRPLRDWALEETDTRKLDNRVHVDNVFNRAGIWTEMTHGYIWRHLHELVNRQLYSTLLVSKVTVDELLKLPKKWTGE